jgi:hypothetical protein
MPCRICGSATRIVPVGFMDRTVCDKAAEKPGSNLKPSL